MILETDTFVFEELRKVADKYKGKRVFLTGHSLGGTRAEIAAMSGDGSQENMLVGDLVDEVHVFNSGSGLQRHKLYLGLGRLRAVLCCHHIFGDILSATNATRAFGGQLFIYKPHPLGGSKHGQDNFTLPPPPPQELAVGKEVIYTPDGSKGKVLVVKDHLVMKCARIEFHSGPLAGKTDDCRESNLFIVGDVPDATSLVTSG